MKTILFFLLSILCLRSNAQYIAVKARYTETRLIDDAPNPAKRENRLVLSFFAVSATGIYSPAYLTNYDLYIYKEGTQYGNVQGGVLDSTGNNYPGYSFTAPKAVSYYNSLGREYIECDLTSATHYIVNGHELDCGFIPVSHWDFDFGTGEALEYFPAPNICLPYYFYEDPYYYTPGNLNFDWSAGLPGPPYNMYNYSCSGPQQLVLRGVLGQDSGNSFPELAIHFADVRALLRSPDSVTISWSNLSESAVSYYVVEHSINGTTFSPLDTVLPKLNNGDKAAYSLSAFQPAGKTYYRIKGVEDSGAVFYSAVVIVTNETAANTTPVTPAILIYPNPVYSGQLQFEIAAAPAGRYVSCIVNAQGQQLRQKMIEHSGGVLSRQQDLTGLPPGTYQLVIRSTTKKFTQTFVYVN